MRTPFGRNLAWLVAVVSGGFVVLAIVLNRSAAVVDPQAHGYGRLLGPLAWLVALANAAFVFWLVYRLLHPMRQLIDAAEEAGVALPEAAPVNSMQSHGDVLDEVDDICARIGRTLPTGEAQRLFPLIVCRSLAMRRLLSVLQRAAPTNTTVLIQGESGTGKELVARGLHANGPRAEGPFVAVNCAAMPATLLESELFGHERGAFTGAVAQRQGLFESAMGGTVFLDEIGDMPLEMQAKLLRVLQERCIQRVGGNATIPVDVRVIAATHRDLQSQVVMRRFREDLFYRISVLQVRLPPLRERRDDIPLLARTFLHGAGRPVPISREALVHLVRYDWPGNVRELQNAIESAVLLADSEVRPEHLPQRIAPAAGATAILSDELRALVDEAMLEGDRLGAAAPAMPPQPEGQPHGDSNGSLLPPGVSLDDYLESNEKRLVHQALGLAAGLQVEAARLLGIKERSLWHRIKKYNIDVSHYRGGEGDAAAS